MKVETSHASKDIQGASQTPLSPCGLLTQGPVLESFGKGWAAVEPGSENMTPLFQLPKAANTTALSPLVRAGGSALQCFGKGSRILDWFLETEGGPRIPHLLPSI